MANMTYEEKYDAVQAFCNKYKSPIDEAPEGSDLWAFKGLDDAMTDIEAVLYDDGEMLLPSNVDGLNRAKVQIINAMLHIAEKWSNETDIELECADPATGEKTIIIELECAEILCEFGPNGKCPSDCYTNDGPLCDFDKCPYENEANEKNGIKAAPREEAGDEK